MTDVFLHLVNISITASWAVLAVLLLRLIFKKAPAALHCCLWGIVGLRLLLPVSLESVFSLIPSAKPLPNDLTVTQTPAINSGFEAVNNAVNPVLQEHLAPTVGESVNPMQVVMGAAANLWLVGLAAILLYGLVSYLRLRHKVRISLPLKDNIYYCDHIPSPFLLGFIRPRIYLPSDLSEEQQPFVVAHEQAHLQRWDHWWKPLGFVLLAVYWFNPLLWPAYVLFCRDVEKACDQRVIRDMDATDRRQYSEALVACSTHQRTVLSCPLAFGEVGVKSRIKSVLYYKKPAFWLVVATAVVGIAAAVCLLTDPLGTGDSLIHQIAHTEGYTVISQERCQITLSFPTSALPDRIDPDKGHEFAEGEVVAYQDNHTTIYLKKIQYANEGPDQVYLCFDCIYRDLPRDSGTVIYPLDILENGFGDAVYVKDRTVRDAVTSYPDAVNERGQGPNEQIWFYLSTDVLEKATGKIEFDVYLNLLVYVKEGSEATAVIQNGSEADTTSATTQIPFVDNSYTDGVIYDSIVFDIDGDGQDERCSIGVGHAYGQFSFTFYVQEAGSEEPPYMQVFYTQVLNDLAFLEYPSGPLRLQGFTQDGECCLYYVGYLDGRITLTEVDSSEPVRLMQISQLESAIGSAYELEQFELTSIKIDIVDHMPPVNGSMCVTGQYVENGEVTQWRKYFSIPYEAFTFLYTNTKDPDHPYLVYNTWYPIEGLNWEPISVPVPDPNVVGYIYNLIFE